MQTFAFGAKAAITNTELVEEQYRLAHHYKNKRVEIERARRAAIGCPGGDPSKPGPVKVCPECGKDFKKTYERPFWHAKPDETLLKETHEVFLNALQAARASDDIPFWGSYLTVDAAAEASKKTNKEPKFRRYDGSGTIAVQIHGDMTVEGLLAGTNTFARITGTGRKRTLSIRIGSEGRAPIWADFPIVYHRPLEGEDGKRRDAPVKWVRVIRRKIGTKLHYEAQVILKTTTPLDAPTKEAVAVDVGWRKLENGDVRVATWVDDAGEHGEIRLSSKLFARWKKTNDLCSIRQKNFNRALDLLVRSRSDSWPEWLREMTCHAHQWERIQHLVKLTLEWRNKRFEGDAALFDELEAWRKQDKRLYEWEANQRQNILLARREIYRLFARKIAEYKLVGVEHLDLRHFAELPDDDDPPEDYRTKAARPRRFQVALSELLNSMAYAVYRAGGEKAWNEMPPGRTTTTCADCGHDEKFDAAGSILRVCPKCGKTWDQDFNAAKNILRAVKEWPEKADRSRLKPFLPKAKSNAEKRRAKAVETRRNRRSKTIEQSTEIVDN